MIYASGAAGPPGPCAMRAWSRAAITASALEPLAVATSAMVWPPSSAVRSSSALISMIWPVSSKRRRTICFSEFTESTLARPAGVVTRGGWKKDTVKAGDKISVRCHVAKDGSENCLLGFLTTPGGVPKEFD